MWQVATWALTGWLAGSTMRRMTRRTSYGITADSVTGLLGAMLGGWLFHRLGVVAPDNLGGHAVVALVGAGVLIVALSTLRHALTTAVPLAGPRQLADDLETQVRRLGEVERRVLSAVLGRRVVSRDPNLAFDAAQTFGERVADRVAAFGGSWPFIGLFVAIMIAWMTLNGELRHPFDPYPYILLNLLLSCLAALQAPIIMMSQNRQAARDGLEARSDYEVNLRAEMAIIGRHDKLDAARADDLATLLRHVSAQTDRLEALQRQVEQLSSRQAGAAAGDARAS